jgi:hypothetical protein
LPFVDLELIRRNPKILCGCSDISALQNAILARAGLVTYSGPHWATFGMRDHFEQTLQWFTAAMFDTSPIALSPAPFWTDDPWFLDQDKREPRPGGGWWPLRQGTAEGRIVGGNLSSLALLQGTPKHALARRRGADRGGRLRIAPGHLRQDADVPAATPRRGRHQRTGHRAFPAGQQDDPPAARADHRQPAGAVRRPRAGRHRGRPHLPDGHLPDRRGREAHRRHRSRRLDPALFDKKALIALAAELGRAGPPYVPPTTDTERRLATAWAEMLSIGVGQIGRDADFFALGGTSLAAVRLVVKLDRMISLQQLVAHPVLRELAARIDSSDSSDASAVESAPPGLLQRLSQPSHLDREPVASVVCFPYAGATRSTSSGWPRS